MDWWWRTVVPASAGLALSFALWYVVKVWIWTPRAIIESCRKQGMSALPFVPFLGQLPEIVAQGDGLAGFLNANCSRGGPGGREPVLFCLGRSVKLVVREPSLVRDVLQRKADLYVKPSFIRALGDLLGDGLLTSSGQSWARQRGIVSPAFYNKELKPKVDVVAGCSAAAMERWGSGELDVFPTFLELTFRILLRATFQLEERKIPPDVPVLVRGFDAYIRCTRERVLGYAAAVPGYRYLPTNLNRKRLRHAAMLRRRVGEIVQGVSSGGLLLERMREQHMGEQEIVDNCVTILMAGHETTASLLTWSVYLLAGDPEWQERGRLEALAAGLGPGWEFASFDKVAQLKSVGMIVWESLRLFPPQPVVGRRICTSNKLGKYAIPADMEVLIPVQALHRDEELWGPDSQEFKPQRFANGIHGACKDPMAYLPFGAGPRTCVGQTLALLEAKVVLAVLLCKYRWKLSPGYLHSPEVTLTLQPRYGMPVILEPVHAMPATPTVLMACDKQASN